MEKDKKKTKPFLDEHQKSFLISLGAFLVATLISFWFHNSASDPSLNIAMIYTLCVFIVGRYTDGYLIGILFSVLSVLSVNFFFTYPYKEINFSLEGYQVTFIGMLMIGMATSVMSTRIKEQSENIQRQEKELADAEKEKMRANLLRAVSHDLRTPLTGIIGNSDSILENGNSLTDEEKNQLVENINDDANWLLNMVENLLTVTRIDGETAKVNKSTEMMDDVISASVIQFRKRFPEAKLNVFVPDELIMADMDPMLIEQVILNILQNAVMHSYTKNPIELSVNSDEDNVIVSIKDYGIGIKKEKLDTIFDGDDFRGGSISADGHKGMGIGLTICKTIISAHGGTISARNHEEGAEFIFTLPKNKEEYEDGTEIDDTYN